MKLQKVMIALGLSTCLIGSQVLAAMAQEQPAVQQEAAAENVVQDVSEESGMISEPAAQPDAVQSAESGTVSEPTAEPEKETPDTEISGTEASDSESDADLESGDEESGNTDPEEGKDGEEAGDNAGEEKGPETDAEGGVDADQEGQETEEGSGQEEGEESGNNSDEEKEPEIGGEAIGNTEREDPEESSRPENTADRHPSAPAEQPAGMSKDKITPDSITSNAILNMGNFLASNKFPDNRDKIKYNVDLPLENIPSFITQEMIIGALKCQDETGYPASVTIAQIIQESGYGKYGPGGEDCEGLSYLAYQYNNLFGIKGTGPAGSVDMRTGEQTSDGTSYMTTAGFRVYNTYTECIEDRAELLDEAYKDLTFGVEDANTFAIKVGSRWATDVDYGQIGRAHV